MGELTPRGANVIIANCEKGTTEGYEIIFWCQTLLDSGRKELEKVGKGRKKSDNRQKESDNSQKELAHQVNIQSVSG